MKLSTDRMIATKDGAIGWMVFNNPEKMNAVSDDMNLAAIEILDAFEKDDEVRVVVLKGAGDKAFISGADIGKFDRRADAGASAQASAPVGGETVDLFDRVRQRYESFPKPTMAMIHGFCLGGGLLTALGVDLRIASEDAQFGIPAARLGIAYPMFGVRRLAAMVGPAKAKEILFTGTRLGAREAERIGLVNRVVPRAELETSVREIAATLCENAPLSIRASKLMIDAITDPTMHDEAAWRAAAARCAASEDFAEGRRAFAEKRKPVFRGR